MANSDLRHDPHLTQRLCDDHIHKIGKYPSVERQNCCARRKSIQNSAGQVYSIHDRAQNVPEQQQISEDECIRLIEQGIPTTDMSTVVIPDSQIPNMPPMPPPYWVSPTAEANKRIHINMVQEGQAAQQMQRQTLGQLVMNTERAYDALSEDSKPQLRKSLAHLVTPQEMETDRQHGRDPLFRMLMKHSQSPGVRQQAQPQQAVGNMQLSDHHGAKGKVPTFDVVPEPDWPFRSKQPKAETSAPVAESPFVTRPQTSTETSENCERRQMKNVAPKLPAPDLGTAFSSALQDELAETSGLPKISSAMGNQSWQSPPKLSRHAGSVSRKRPIDAARTAASGWPFPEESTARDDQANIGASAPAQPSRPESARWTPSSSSARGEAKKVARTPLRQDQLVEDGFESVSLDEPSNKHRVEEAIWDMSSLKAALDDNDDAEEWQHVKEYRSSAENGKNGLKGGRSMLGFFS